MKQENNNYGINPGDVFIYAPPNSPPAGSRQRIVTEVKTLPNEEITLVDEHGREWTGNVNEFLFMR